MTLLMIRDVSLELELFDVFFLFLLFLRKLIEAVMIQRWFIWRFRAASEDDDESQCLDGLKEKVNKREDDEWEDERLLEGYF